MSAAAGFFVVPRVDADLFGDPQDEPLCRRGAFAWLFDNAAWKPVERHIGAARVRLDRGELCFSYRYLARAWGWTHGRVQRWLRLLVQRALITIREAGGIIVISLRGYGERPHTESPKPVTITAHEGVRDQDASQRRIKSNQQCVKKEGDALGRCAPVTDADRAYVAETVEKLKRSVTGRRPPPVVDEIAYAAAVKKEKRKVWIRTLGDWVSRKFIGAARMQAWEMLAEAEKAGSRAATPKPVREIIDRLDKLYREDGARIEAATQRAREQRRRQSIGAVNAVYR